MSTLLHIEAAQKYKSPVYRSGFIFDTEHTLCTAHEIRDYSELDITESFSAQKSAKIYRRILDPPPATPSLRKWK